MRSAANVADVYPLSPSQHGLLMVVLLAPDRARFYCDQVVLDLSGHLDAAAWREAWRRVVARHPALRTQFAWGSGRRWLLLMETTGASPNSS